MMNSNHIVCFSFYVFDHIYWKIGHLFYLVNPYKTMFEEVLVVPRYVEGVILMLILLLAIYMIICDYI